MNIGIDHGYSAVKTRHFSFPAGISAYSYEPYTLQNTLEYGGQYFVCGTGRQPILRNKTENRNYYLLTLAAIAKEIRQRGEKTECSVTIGAGLPLTLFGREKKAFREYLLYPEKPEDSLSPVCFKFEGVPYRITVQDVKLFPQGYSALAVHPELLRDEPSVLLMDIGGWTVDLMRLDKGIPDASTCRSLRSANRCGGIPGCPSLTPRQSESCPESRAAFRKKPGLSSGGRDGCTRSACFPRSRKPGLTAEHCRLS